MGLDGYRLVVLPEDFAATPAFAQKLERFVAGGGAVIVFAGGEQLPDGGYPACCGAQCKGKNELYPDFLVAEGPLANGLAAQNEYIIYEQGVVLQSVQAPPLMYGQSALFCTDGRAFLLAPLYAQRAWHAVPGHGMAPKCAAVQPPAAHAIP